jgi:hypothetical protein
MCGKTNFDSNVKLKWCDACIKERRESASKITPIYVYVSNIHIESIFLFMQMFLGYTSTNILPRRFCILQKVMYTYQDG